MEDIWNDMNLTSLPESTITVNAQPLRICPQPTTTAANYPSMMFQDYLGTPNFGSSHPPPPPPTPITMFSNHHAPAPSPDSTLLFLANPHQYHCSKSNNNQVSNVSSYTTSRPFHSSSSLLPSYGNKSFIAADNGCAPDDKHLRRMIKNRESACRSRARKEAYRSNLENEVAKLSEENRKLRKKQIEIDKEIAAEQELLSKKRILYRTSTAPF